MEIIKIILLIILSYLIGAIPFSYIICKILKGIDIRTIGSKNAGATNAGRILGKQWFFIITILDAVKGYLMIILTKYLISQDIIPIASIIPVLIGLSVIFGHTFSIFLNFNGGKGVAVSAGVLLGFDYRILLVSLIVFIIVVVISKYISLGSIIGGLILPINVIYFYKDDLNYYLLIFCLLISFYVLYKHKNNIKRIINKKERKWGERI